MLKKKALVIILTAVMSLSLTACDSSGGEDRPTQPPSGAGDAELPPVVSTVPSIWLGPAPAITPSPELIPTPTPTPEPIPTPEPTPSLTMGQKNALSKAKDYLSVLSFSHSGLIEQLEYEGFTTDEATYAADNCGADWNEQAAIKAQGYLDVMSFSRSGLIDQLVYDGFTSEQAEYGVTAVGY